MGAVDIWRHELMGFAALVAVIGLVFGMISIKLMSIVENAQVVAGMVKGNRRRDPLNQVQGRRVVVFAISTPKLVFLRIGIFFFGRISAIIFVAEAMYPERVVEGAAMAMMKTVVVSNRIRVVTVKNGRHAIKKIKLKNSKSGPQEPAQ